MPTCTGCSSGDSNTMAGPGPKEVGWLSVYQRLVRPLPEGAVLRPAEPAS